MTQKSNESAMVNEVDCTSPLSDADLTKVELRIMEVLLDPNATEGQAKLCRLLKRLEIAEAKNKSIAPLVTALDCIGKAYLAKKYPQTDGSEVWELRVHKKDYLDMKEVLSAFKAKMEGLKYV